MCRVARNVANVCLNCNAGNLDETYTEAKVGPEGHHRFHTPALRNIQRIRGKDRQNHGAQGCLASRPRVRNPDDSIFHQSRREKPQRASPRGTRAGEANSAAASGQAESWHEEAVTEQGPDRIAQDHCGKRIRCSRAVKRESTRSESKIGSAFSSLNDPIRASTDRSSHMNARSASPRPT
jgi:hypothetical protein